MRQVPYHYMIIGNGRLATHMVFYLKTLGISVNQWARSTHSYTALPSLLSPATHIWILIRDDAIQPFIEEHLKSYESSHTLLHSSGALTLQNAYGAHPLYSFTPSLYSIERYLNLPFFLDASAPVFEQLLPGLSNPHYRILPHQKAYYHALCVMANNFTTLLWQKFFTSMEQEFGLKPEDAQPYLKQTCENLCHNYYNALTGPIARSDQTTLQRNIHALENDSYHAIFKAFVQTHCPDLLKDKENHHGKTCN